jgi:hypothetical protein
VPNGTYHEVSFDYRRARREKIAAAVEGYGTIGALELPGTAEHVLAD